MKKNICYPIYAFFIYTITSVCKTFEASELIMAKAIEVFKDRKIIQNEICERSHDIILIRWTKQMDKSLEILIVFFYKKT